MDLLWLGPPYPTPGETVPFLAPPYPPNASAPYPPPGGPPYPPSGGASYPPPGAGYPPGQPAYPPTYPSPHPTADINPDFARQGFSDKSVRHGFIRKVYLILTAQLLVTCGIVCLFLLQRDVRYWVQRNAWFYYVSYAVFLVTYIALVCCPGVRRRFPGNFIALAIFTLAFSYVTGTISSFHSIEAVLITLAITTALCLAISIFAIQTRIDFTKCTALIMVVTVVFILTGLACMIVYLVSGPNRVLQGVYGGIGALVFGLYLAFDTQAIIGGRKYELGAEEYIYGALQLYMDVVNMFLLLLTLVGSRD